MKRSILACLLITLVACTKDEEEITYPSCLDDKVQIALNGPVRTPKSSIKEYSYLSQEVFIFSLNGISDEQLFVVDKDCSIICKFGGINGINTCGDLNDLVFVETVWEDPR